MWALFWWKMHKPTPPTLMTRGPHVGQLSKIGPIFPFFVCWRLPLASQPLPPSPYCKEFQLRTELILEHLELKLALFEPHSLLYSLASLVPTVAKLVCRLHCRLPNHDSEGLWQLFVDNETVYWRAQGTKNVKGESQQRETSPEFWQMSNMEYLHWGYGVCRYVLSIEYDHGIFALGVCDMHHHHCWDGGQIDQGG